MPARTNLNIDSPRFIGVTAFGRWANESYGIYMCKTPDCGRTIKHAVKRIPLEGLSPQQCRRCRERKLPFEVPYNRLKAGAAERGYSCELSYEEFLELTREVDCTYCGFHIVWARHGVDGGTTHDGYYVDRKVNSIGYTKDNCVRCCALCNRLKGDRLTFEEMMLLRPGLEEIQKRRLANAR